MISRFDHIAMACETLAAGRIHVEAQLGMSLEPGGRHARFGTHNMLLGLADGLYFELIAIDPDAPDPGRRRWFDLDDFAGPPRLTNWICATDDLGTALARAPEGMGRPEEMRRGDLRWQMAAGQDGHLPFEQGFPALICWGDSPHPATRLQPSGLRLDRLVVANPQADALRAALAPLLRDPRVEIVRGAVPALRAELSAGARRVVLE